jgi:hypothetical protein
VEVPSVSWHLFKHIVVSYAFTDYVIKKVKLHIKVKLSHYRPGHAQRLPRG